MKDLFYEPNLTNTQIQKDRKCLVPFVLIHSAQLLDLFKTIRNDSSLTSIDKSMRQHVNLLQIICAERKVTTIIYMPCKDILSRVCKQEKHIPRFQIPAKQRQDLLILRFWL